MYSIVSDRILFNCFDWCNERVYGIKIFSKPFWWVHIIYNCVNGKKHGLYGELYKSGKLYENFNYVDGKEHGVWERWTEDGKLWEKCNYLDGKKHGLHEKWYEKSSKLYYTCIYVYGKEQC